MATLPGPGTYRLPVVGESNYQNHLERICGKRKRDGEDRIIDAILVLEDTNPHDKNAVRIEIRGMTVGYLSRDHAMQYRKKLKRAGHPKIKGTCSANIRGGWDRGGDDKGYYGVWLDIPMAE